MTIAVQLLLSVNGGAYAPGPQKGIAPASTVALKTSVNGGLLNAIRYEIYEYPPGFPCPSGWVVDPTTVSATSTGVYIFQPSNVTTPPPSFSLPASGAQNWGWFMCRVRGNNNPNQINDDGTQNANFNPALVDEQGCVNVPSPVLGAEGVARGLTTQVDGLRAWVGPLMQSLRAMDNAASGASFSAGGDLAGSGISQTVVALRGNPLSAVAPTAGQFLVEQAGATGSAWTSISGDATASATTPGKLTVTGIQGSAVPSPSTGFLQWTGSAFAWSTPGGGFTAGGDLGGTSTNQNVLAVHGASVPSAGGPVTGNVLQVVGSSALNYGAVNLAGGAGFVTGILPAGNQAAQTMLGDVTGTTAASVVSKVNGATVPAAGALTPGNVLQVLSAGGLTYGTVNLSNPNSVSGSVSVAQGGTGLSAIGTANQLLGVNSGGSALYYFTPGGDATLSAGNFTVVGLQGRAVVSTAPTNGQALIWSSGSSQWQPTTLGSGASVTGSGVWHSTSGALDAAASKGTAGQFLTTNAGATDTGWTTISGDVAASVSTVGQLTVTALQTHGVSSSAPTAGQFLIENAGASSWVPTSLSQDVSASLVTPGAITVVGIRTVSVPALATGYLQYTGTVFAWTTPANSSVTGSGVWHSTAGVLDAAASKGTAGQFLVTNAGATDTPWVSLSADVTASTGTPGAITVVAIRGNPVTVTAATAGQVLIENAGATASAWTSFSGDVTLSTGTPGLATVVGLKGQTVPTLASGWLQWNGSAFVWSTPPGAFTAGGDLSGTNTSQTVIGIQGRAVASTAPTNGQVLEWNNGASQWQPTSLPGGTSVTGSGVWHSTAGTLDGAANRGTAGQFLTTNAGATDTVWSSISGDATNSVSTVGKLTVTGIQGNPVSGTAATAGQVLIENSGATGSAWTSFSGDVTLSTGTPGAATVVAIQGHGVVSTAPTAGQFLIENAAATNWVPTSLSGDVSASTGTPGLITVTGLKSNAIPSLASGFLQWTGSAFAWGTPSGTFTAGGDLSGTSSSQTVIGIQGNPVNATAATAGQFLIENAAATGSKWTTLAGDVTASLVTPGSITVTGIRGNPVSGTAATAGQVLIENSGATGSAWTSFSQDVTLSTSTPGQASVVGIRANAIPALASGFLQWTGSAFAWSTPAGAFTAGGDLSGSPTSQTVIGIQGNPVNATAATAGQLLIENSGATGSKWTSFSGDVTLSTSVPGAATVVALHGNAISATVPTAGQFLVENAGATSWGPVSISGDVSASVSTVGQLTVTGIRGTSIPSLAAGYLQYTGSAFAWTSGGVQALIFQPGGTAGGPVYTSWSALVAAAGAVQGPLTVYIDGSHNGGAATIPSGTWTFTNQAVTLAGGSPDTTSGFTLPPNTTVTCATGCVLQGVTNFDSMTLLFAGTAPVVTVSSGATNFIVFSGVALQVTSTNPFLRVTGSAQVSVDLRNVSVLGDSVHAAFDSTSSGNSQVFLRDASLILPSSITGGSTRWGVQVYSESATNQAVGPLFGYVTNPSILIFAPGSPLTDNNLFTDWATLVMGANSLTGPLTIFFDGSNVGGVCTIPSGTWAFNNPQLRFQGSGTPGNPNTVASCASGAVITGLTVIDTLVLKNTGASAVLTYSSGFPTIYVTGGALQGSASGPLISVTGTGALLLEADGYASLGDGTHAFASTSSSGGSQIVLLDAAITANALSGTNWSIVVNSAQATVGQAGYPIQLNAAASLTGYDDTLHTPHFSVSDVQDAIDHLKTLVGGGTITQLTGDVLAGPGSGSQVATVVAISGTSPIPITPNVLQWVQSATGPELTQAQQANAAAPKNFTIAPQAPGASATNATNGTPGSLIVNVAVPVNGGTEAAFVVQRNATPMLSTGLLSGVSGTGSIWLGNVTPSSTNFVIASNAGNTALNGISTVNIGIIGGGIAGSGGGAIMAGTDHGIQFFNVTPSFGGGAGVIGITDATTVPTSAPAGGSLLYSDSGSIEIFASGFQFHRLGTPAILQVGATTDVTPQNLVITPQAPFSGATTTGHKTPGSVAINLPVPVSGGLDGSLLIQRSGSTLLQFGPVGAGTSFQGATFASGLANPIITQAAPPGDSPTTTFTIQSQSAFASATSNKNSGELKLIAGTAVSGGVASVFMGSSDLTNGILVQKGSANAINLTTDGNVFIGTASNPGPSDGGVGVVGLASVGTAPTSFAHTSGIEFYANPFGLGGTQIGFEVNASAYLINPNIVAGGIGQLPQSGSVAGTTFTVFAQQAGGGNNNGGNLILHAGAGAGSGTMGSAIMQTPDSGATGAVQVSLFGASMQAGGSLSTPRMGVLVTTLGAIASSVDGSGSNYDQHYLTYTVDGTFANQKPSVQRQVLLRQITTSGGSQQMTFSMPNNGTGATFTVTAQAKITTAGSGTSVGDQFQQVTVAAFKQNGGTITALGSATNVLLVNDSHFAFSGISFTISGSNLEIVFTLSTASGTLGTADIVLRAVGEFF